MKIQKKLIIFILLFLTVFLLGFYSFYQIDNLIKFAPKNTFLYLHLDLNNYTKKGGVTHQWLREKYFNQFLENSLSNQVLIDRFFKEENYKFFNQISLVIPFSQDKNSAEPVLLLVKMKRFINSDKTITEIRNQGFFIEKINQKVFLIAPHPVSLEKKENGFLFQSKKTSWSEFMSPPVFTGFFNLEFLSKNFKNNDLIKFKAFSCLDEKEIIVYFKTDNLNDFNSENFNEELFSSEEVKKRFVLVYSSLDKNLEVIKKRIKELLAWQKPLKQEKVLPDQTTFNELIVDPQLFEFKEKKIDDQTLFYLEEENIGFWHNVFLWQEGANSFIGNHEELAKRFIQESLIENIWQREPNFAQALYFEFNQQGLKEGLLIQTENEIKAWLIFN
jgi:hypothetical protein